ncbi:MAG: arginyl-tRNA synthetase [Thermotogaceae bacterium]|nr:arginyl-tRNA synthetase [Thermotogaceae bacterium]
MNDLSKIVKDNIFEMIFEALNKVDKNLSMDFRVEIPPNEQFGDFSTNVAMINAKNAKTSPRKLAEKIVVFLEENSDVEKVEIAGPGFINLFLSQEFYQQKLMAMLHEEAQSYFHTNLGQKQKIQLEFVSANPTGPLTVGHGRQAVIGDVLSSIYERFGYEVTREYYFNDAGRQMKLLAKSVYIRYNELFGIKEEIPDGGYKGEYIIDIAKAIKNNEGDKFKEKWNEETESYFLHQAKDEMFKHIKNTLNSMNVHFDVYFSEGSLFTDGTVEKVKAIFREKDLIYVNDGALWLKVSEFIDEKDKVLIRSDGMPTYFFTDIANHYKKHERGFKKVFDIWGADHHGHIPRMQAAMKALDFDEDFFNVILHQMVTLKQKGEAIKMSTRQGTFITLDELLEMVGRDATRYFYAMVDKDGQLIFDIDLARSTSMDNPVYYVQYAHARICSLIKNAENKGLNFVPGENLQELNSRQDSLFIRDLMLYTDALIEVIQTNSPHKLTNYIHDLASKFHQYYNSNVFVDKENEAVSNARLSLAFATRKVIKDALMLLGVSAPEIMEQI